MPTTSNFGWTTPADTDLVKDGAAAIRTLGNGIDTSLVDLKGGMTGQILSKASNTDLDFTWTSDATGIQATIFDAKGDLIAASAADTAARLAVGTNGQVLTADSTTATGLKWATPGSGGLTQISQVSFNNTSGVYTVTGISGSYKHLYISGIGIKHSGTVDRVLTLRMNNDSGSNYSWAYGGYGGSGGDTPTTSIKITDFIPRTTDTAVRLFGFSLWIPNYADTAEVKNCQFITFGAPNGSPTVTVGGGTYGSTSAITEISFSLSSNNFSDGMITVYGEQ